MHTCAATAHPCGQKPSTVSPAPFNRSASATTSVSARTRGSANCTSARNSASDLTSLADGCHSRLYGILTSCSVTNPAPMTTAVEDANVGAHPSARNTPYETNPSTTIPGYDTIATRFERAVPVRPSTITLSRARGGPIRTLPERRALTVEVVPQQQDEERENDMEERRDAL